jgi:hypothetical protein
MEILVPFWYKSRKPGALCSWRNLLEIKTDRRVTSLGAARVQPMPVSVEGLVPRSCSQESAVAATLEGTTQNVEQIASTILI